MITVETKIIIHDTTEFDSLTDDDLNQAITAANEYAMSVIAQHGFENYAIEIHVDGRPVSAVTPLISLS